MDKTHYRLSDSMKLPHVVEVAWNHRCDMLRGSRLAHSQKQFPNKTSVAAGSDVVSSFAM